MDSPKTEKLQLLPILLTGLVVGLGILIYFFANFREEKTIQEYFETLRQGNLPKAYQLWGPTDEYSYRDFMIDWGPKGYYGKIKRFEIVSSKSQGTGVVIMVQLNNLRKPIGFWVERKTQKIGFSPIAF